jgi:hypothetical protein
MRMAEPPHPGAPVLTEGLRHAHVFGSGSACRGPRKSTRLRACQM